MMPPMRGKQASAAATFDGRPVEPEDDVVMGVEVTGGGALSGMGGGGVIGGGSSGSAMLLCDRIHGVASK